MREIIMGLAALGLLATAPARADDKVEQKAETKTSKDGKKTKHKKEAKHTKDTANGITPEMFAQLADVETLVAIKESSENVRRITDLGPAGSAPGTAPAGGESRYPAGCCTGNDSRVPTQVGPGAGE